MKNLLLSLCLLLLGIGTAQAATPVFNFERGKKYYIGCQFTEGYVALGANHGSNCEIYYVQGNNAVAEDGYWYIEARGSNYTFKNASTGQYLAWCDVYSNTCKYLTLVNNVDDNALWTINNLGNYASVQNVAQPTYKWNLRTSTFLMGSYAGGLSTNSYFSFYAEGDGDGGNSGGSTDDEQLWDSKKIYTIHNINNFGYIIYNPDLITEAPVIAGFDNEKRECYSELFRNPMTPNDPNNQWRIIGDGNGKYAFYNVGKQSYMYVSTLIQANDISSRNIVFSNTPTYFTPIERENGVYVFSLPVTVSWGDFSYDTEFYLCDAPQQAPGSTILLYSDINDIGSQFEISEVNLNNQINVQDLVLNSTAIKLPVGKSYTLPMSIRPDDATDKRLAWTSSNTFVTSVDENGTVTGLSAGTASVTATTCDGSKISTTCEIQVYEPVVNEPTGDILYIHQSSGAMDAFPMDCIATRTESENGGLTISTIDGKTFNYLPLEVVSVSNTAPEDLPHLTSFKFNNKYNDQLPADVIANGDTLENGSIRMPETINLSVGSAIGKRLTPSFNASTEDATVYVNGVEQISKKTRLRFDRDIVYTVAPRAHKIYTSTAGSADILDISIPSRPVVLVGDTDEARYVWMPYGRKHTVHVDWATDKSTGQYNVPAVYITLNDNAMLTDIKKESYLAATIRVDGAGVYPDFPETAVSIKGRGNSSWGGSTTSTKNPYRLKFESKQKLFDLKKGKNWVLLANKQRGSMTTNALAMKVADMVQTAGCNHIIPVELYINGEYRGSYNFTEKVGFANNSIDLEDESTAFMLELDTYTSETIYRDNIYNICTKIHEPDIDEIADLELQEETRDAILQHWREFTSAVYNDDNYESWIDVDAFVRAMFVTDLCRNQELKHPKSWFLYNENALAYDLLDGFTLNYESPYVFGPVWDFDWAYGYDGTGVYFIHKAEDDIFNSGGVGTPFFQKLLRGSDVVKKAYYALWSDFMNNGGLRELIEYCDDYYNYVNPSFLHNDTKWNDGKQYATQTANAKTWLTQRAQYIFNNLTPYDISHEEQADAPGNGDANGDGSITTADVVCIINHVLGITNENFEIRLADTDGNNLVTMKDAATVVRKLMEQPANSTRQLHIPTAEASWRPANFVAAVGEEAQMPLTLTLGESCYSALQFDTTLPEGMQLTGITLPGTLQGYTATTARIDDRHYRISLYAGANNAMPTGKMMLQIGLIADELITPDARIVSITDAMLVDTKAEDNRLPAISVRFYMPDETTAIERIATRTASQSAETYDLQGRRVVRPQQGGVYIVGGKKTIQ